MRLSLVCEELDTVAPPALAEDYDNVGLLLGNPNADVKVLALSLEATEQTVNAAVEKGADLLLTHHPFIFRAIKSIDLAGTQGRIIERALRGNLAIYAAHTNFDAVDGGMNDALCARLGLAPVGPALPSQGEKACKIVTFVPEAHVEPVARAMFRAGAGRIGNYTGCSFQSPGVGTFLPEAGAHPYSGQAGDFSREPEIRIEVLAPSARVSRVVAGMLAAHPYEEPAFDVYPLAPADGRHGHGRIAILEKPVRLDGLARRVMKALGLKSVRMTGNKSRRIARVAVCGGSGAFLIPALSDPERTCLVTGDVKYHDARLAEERGLSVIDAGHFGTEILFIQTMKRILADRLKDPSTGEPVRLVSLAGEKDPFLVVS